MTSLFERFSALVTAMVLASVATAFAVFPVMFVPGLQLPAAHLICNGEAHVMQLPAATPGDGQGAQRQVRCAAAPERDITRAAMGLTFFGAWAVMTLVLVGLFAYREFTASNQNPSDDDQQPLS